MQENKLVSAIITTHNRLDLLKQAIKSVKQQTYIDYIYISPAESKGGNHARNVVIENSHGEYLTEALGYQLK